MPSPHEGARRQTSGDLHHGTREHRHGRSSRVGRRLRLLQKPVDEKRLLRSLEKAAARSYQEITGAVSADTARERLSQLTARETEIVKLIAAGLVSREIAERLGIALRTVEVHRAGALKKIGTHDPSAIKRLLETAGV